LIILGILVSVQWVVDFSSAKGDAKWIVIRRSLWGHNDTPCGQPALGQPIGCPGSGRLQGEIGVFSYYKLVILFLNIVALISEFTSVKETALGMTAPRV
jgi:hypothetical protein